MAQCGLCRLQIRGGDLRNNEKTGPLKFMQRCLALKKEIGVMAVLEQGRRLAYNSKTRLRLCLSTIFLHVLPN
jgi:hypothetical protein